MKSSLVKIFCVVVVLFGLIAPAVAAKDKQAYDDFTSGEFEFDAQAQAVAVTAGAQAQAGTAGASAGASAGPKTGVQAKAAYVDGMVTFVHAKGGLMYEFSIGGQRFTFTPL